MKNFLQKIILFIGKLFHAGAEFSNEYLTPAIKFLNGLKQLIDNPKLDAITAWTSTGFDDVLLVKFRMALAKIVDLLAVTDECLMKQTDDEKIQCFIEQLREIPDDARDALLIKAASLMGQYMAEQDEQKFEGKKSDIDLLAQVAYCKLKNKMDETE